METCQNRQAQNNNKTINLDKKGLQKRCLLVFFFYTKFGTQTGGVIVHRIRWKFYFGFFFCLTVFRKSELETCLTRQQQQQKPNQTNTMWQHLSETQQQQQKKPTKRQIRFFFLNYKIILVRQQGGGEKKEGHPLNSMMMVWWRSAAPLMTDSAASRRSHDTTMNQQTLLLVTGEADVGAPWKAGSSQGPFKKKRVHTWKNANPDWTVLTSVQHLHLQTAPPPLLVTPPPWHLPIIKHHHLLHSTSWASF